MAGSNLSVAFPFSLDSCMIAICNSAVDNIWCRNRIRRGADVFVSVAPRPSPLRPAPSRLYLPQAGDEARRALRILVVSVASELFGDVFLFISVPNSTQSPPDPFAASLLSRIDTHPPKCPSRRSFMCIVSLFFTSRDRRLGFKVNTRAMEHFRYLRDITRPPSSSL